MTDKPQPKPTIDQRNQTVEGDQLNIAGDYLAGDEAYDVSGLLNPYLGLKAFTYADRAIYAGRNQEIVAAVGLLTEPGAERALLFVTGASGSGKSSFAQAGLLPALEKHWQGKGLVAVSAVFRPGERPRAGLAGALRVLNLPAKGIFAPAAEYELAPPQAPAKPEQVSLLVIDQFEELFSQSEPAQREAIFALLAELPPFHMSHMHIIATMRADYLPDLFGREALYDFAKTGIDLRAMGEADLRAAIQRPLQVTHPEANKRFQMALLSQLATDAAEDAAYLPLLQVTLEDLWNQGLLTIDHYKNLADAIGRRAEDVYRTKRKPDGTMVSRSTEEQETILNIFLDLVDVSLSDDIHRAVRRTRPLGDITRGSHSVESVVQELATARLLTTDEEELGDSGEEIESLDIIHDALIVNWARLRQQVDRQRDRLHQRKRFEQVLAEWLDHGQDDAYLLTGIRLAEAQDLDGRGDISMRGNAARTLLARSIAERDRKRRRNRRIILSLTTAAFIAAIAATFFGLNANQQRNEARRQAGLAAANAAIAETRSAEAVAAMQAADEERAKAEREARRSRASGLAALAQKVLDQPDLSGSKALLLAREAVLTTFNPDGVVASDADAALRAAIDQSSWRLTLPGARHTAAINDIDYSADGRMLVTASDDQTVRIWDAVENRLLTTLVGHTAPIRSAAIDHVGQRVASGDESGVLRIWNLNGSSADQIIAAHADKIFAVDIDRSGQLLASAGADQVVRLWRLADSEEIHTLAGHMGDIRAVAFHPDGGTLASAGADRTVRIWDVGTGSLIDQLVGHDDWIYAIDYSLDGQLLASTGEDSTIRIWDVETGEELRTFPGHDDDYIHSVRFDTSGTRIVTTGADNTVRIWDVATGELLLTLAEHKGDTLSATFSPDGSHVASVGEDKTIQMWDSRTGDAQEFYPLLRFPVRAAVFSADGDRVATAHEDGVVALWDATTGEQLHHRGAHDGAALAVAASSDGRLLASAGVDGTVIVWDAQDLTQELQFSAQQSFVGTVAFSPDSERLITGGGDNLAIVSQVSTGKPEAILSGHESFVTSVEFNSDGRLALTASADGTARLWDVATESEIAKLETPEEAIWSAKLSPDGAMALLGTDGDEASLWTIEGEQIFQLTGHDDSVRAVAFSPDGRYLLTGSPDRTARLWDARTGALVRVLYGHTDEINSVDFSPDGRQIVTASGGHFGNNTTRVWDLHPEDENRILRGHEPNSTVRSITISPDGTRFASAGDDATIRLWDARTGDLLETITNHTERVRSVVFDRNGEYLLSSGDDNVARIWNIAEARQEQLFAGHKLWVRAAAFIPARREIVTASEDQTVRIWDKDTGGQLARLEGHEEQIITLAVAPDGKRIITGGFDRTVRVWDTASRAEILTYENHKDTVRAVVLTNDGQTVISAGGGPNEDYSIHLWDINNGETIEIVNGHTAEITALLMPPDDAWFASGDINGVVSIWSLPDAKLLRKFIDSDSAVWSLSSTPKSGQLATARDDGTIRLSESSIDGLVELASSRIQRSPPIWASDERIEYGIVEDQYFDYLAATAEK